MLNAPLLLLKEKEVEDEVKKLNKDIIAQERFFFLFTKKKEEQNKFTTMMIKEPEAGNKKKKIKKVKALTHLINERSVVKCRRCQKKNYDTF
jgi:hypothetical protein